MGKNEEKFMCVNTNIRKPFFRSIWSRFFLFFVVCSCRSFSFIQNTVELKSVCGFASKKEIYQTEKCNNKEGNVRIKLARKLYKNKIAVIFMQRM